MVNDRIPRDLLNRRGQASRPTLERLAPQTFAGETPAQTAGTAAPLRSSLSPWSQRAQKLVSSRSLNREVGRATRPYVLSAVVGTARCAVRAPYEGRNVWVTCACGAIASARSHAGGDIAARCPYPLNRYSRTSGRAGFQPVLTSRMPVPLHRRRKTHGAFLTIELVVAMAILLVALLPLSYAFWHEHKLSRACYYRAVAMEIVDGEMEVLLAGEWRAFGQGPQPYQVRAESARNLPAGRFVLTLEAKRLRLEWLPDKRSKAGRVAREVTLP